MTAEQPTSLKNDPAFADALDEAKRRRLTIPADIWARVGACVVPGARATARLLMGLADLLWEIDMDDGTPPRRSL